MTVKIFFTNSTGETLTRTGQLGAVDWFQQSVSDGATAQGEGKDDDGWVSYQGASGSVTIRWQVSGDGSVTMSSATYPTQCTQCPDEWVLTAKPFVPSVPAAPSCTTTVGDRVCLCQPCFTSDAACLIAIIADRLKEGVLTQFPGWFAPGGGATCCGDVLHSLFKEWGSKDSFWFGVDTPEKPGKGTMPSAGDIFALCKAGDPSTREHVGIIYRIRGTPDSFEWQSAEGGQENSAKGNPGLMWINPNYRGIKGKNTDLQGWKKLSTITRDRTLCRGKIGQKKK